jgi:hypothetical protein
MVCLICWSNGACHHTKQTAQYTKGKGLLLYNALRTLKGVGLKKSVQGSRDILVWRLDLSKLSNISTKHPSHLKSAPVTERRPHFMQITALDVFQDAEVSKQEIERSNCLWRHGSRDDIYTRWKQRFANHWHLETPKIHAQSTRSYTQRRVEVF